MTIKRLISILMVLFLLWTGTLLHDMAEQEGALSHALNGLDKKQFAEITLEPPSEIGTLDSEEHFHDAAIPSHTEEYGFVGHISTTQPRNIFALQILSNLEIHRPVERPPPLISFNLPTRMFLAKQALLV